LNLKPVTEANEKAWQNKIKLATPRITMNMPPNRKNLSLDTIFLGTELSRKTCERNNHFCQ